MLKLFMIAGRYWDANPFCAIFNNEVARLPECLAVVKAAEAGEVKIVSSSITLTEVVRIKNQPRLGPGKEAVLFDFFQNDYLLFVNVDWFIGTKARRLIHDHPALKPMDAIHLATAIRGKVEEMHTYDSKLCKLTGKIGVPPLKICHPSVANPELPLSESPVRPPTRVPKRLMELLSEDPPI